MMAVDETPSTGACGVQDSVPFGVGDAVWAENPRARDSGIFKEGPPGSAGISPGLVSGGDWGRTGPCADGHGPVVHLHMVIPPKYAVSRVVETLKSVTSRRLKEKFPHVLSKVYWDGGGVRGTRIFCLHGGYQRSHHSAVCAAPRRAGDGLSAAC